MSERTDEPRKLGRKLFSVYESANDREEFTLVAEPHVSPMQAFILLLRAITEGAEELEQMLIKLGDALKEPDETEGEP